jgi:hypothetical protein
MIKLYSVMGFSVRSELGQNLSKEAKGCYAFCNASMVCRFGRLVANYRNVQDFLRRSGGNIKINSAGYYSSSCSSSPLPLSALLVASIATPLCIVQVAGSIGFVKGGFACLLAV